jgi:hypothetical protein
MKSLIKGYGREKRLGTAGLDYRLTDSCRVDSLTRIEALYILYIYMCIALKHVMTYNLKHYVLLTTDMLLLSVTVTNDILVHSAENTHVDWNVTV